MGQPILTLQSTFLAQPLGLPVSVASSSQSRVTGT
jgi:hypothetical protein